VVRLVLDGVQPARVPDKVIAEPQKKRAQRRGGVAAATTSKAQRPRAGTTRSIQRSLWAL
jgi:hypothetical protein